MELICPHCGRDRLWYDPYTGNFDCPTCGTPTLPEELPDSELYTLARGYGAVVV